MSFILDALRKSEAERQRQSAPSLADTRYHVSKKKPSVWFPVIAIVLAANAAGIAFVIFDDASDVNQPEPAANAVVSGVTGKAPLAPVTAIEPAATQASVPRQVVSIGEPPPVEIEPYAAPEVSAPAVLPSLQQLMMSGRLSVEPLHVDIHVYAGEPSKRFVSINRNKYREGDRLQEGPTIEEITQSGVVLNYQGNRFTLNRK